MNTGFKVGKILIPVFKKSKNEILENYRQVLGPWEGVEANLGSHFQIYSEEKSDRLLSVWI